MAPNKKPAAEIGGVEVRNGRFRARVHARTGRQHGPTRSTEEAAQADLTVARNGATDKEDVARHLAELAAAASGQTATSEWERRRSPPHQHRHLITTAIGFKKSGCGLLPLPSVC